MKEINNFQLSFILSLCPMSTLQNASSKRTTLLYEESKAMYFLTVVSDVQSKWLLGLFSEFILHNYV